ncbi:RNA polymerase [Paractinoplanes deccanensis]|uniref:RNA polymerase n=1 Tax=Paractinoplanes deccanensis TaxID=113561 RepID=A0ABQ3XYX6_9ACTN|nr:sigma factor-like helix-turn-helix DNA-binding protein [Actinoplanes deccanensis]GID72957.1 RNA polymerase [Actinoplanes deccanensis]
MTFEQFAMARLPSLLRFAVVLTGDRELAQDIVQEVLARAQARWRRISQTEDLETYVRRMVLTEYLSWRRFWAVRRLRPRTVQGGLWERLAGLGRKQRAVLVLRHYEELDDERIADLLGSSRAAVRGHASRALKTLRLEPELAHCIPAEEKS